MSSSTESPTKPTNYNAAFLELCFSLFFFAFVLYAIRWCYLQLQKFVKKIFPPPKPEVPDLVIAGVVMQGIKPQKTRVHPTRVSNICNGSD